MYVGDVGTRICCWMVLLVRIGVGAERARVGLGSGCGYGRVGLASRRQGVVGDR